MLPQTNDTSFNSKEQIDPLLKDAARLLFHMGTASVAVIQRVFGLGYSRASNIMDKLYELGIVGALNGNLPRAILVWDEASLERILENL